MQINWVGCASSNFRQGRPAGLVPEAIVIHIIVGSLRSADNHFADGASRVSAHYGVGRNGEVHQYVDERDTAFHAGTVVGPSWQLIKPNINPNFYTIGIEHEGMPDQPWTEVQIETSALLISQIAHRWSVPLTRQHIIGHHEVRATKTCPGSWINLDDLVAQVPVHPVHIQAVPRTVRAISNLNLRSGKPATSAPVVQTVLSGTEVAVVGFTDGGHPIKGNPCWYLDGQGNYFWAGATEWPDPRQAIQRRLAAVAR